MASSILPLSLSLFFLLPAVSFAAEPLHFTLSRRSGHHDMDYYASAAQHLRGKYGRTKPVKGRRATAGISMVNQQSDASYFATVNIGTPIGPTRVLRPAAALRLMVVVPFNVILDTGSSDLWVADSSCTTCNRVTPVFEASASTSLQLSASGTNIRYGSGEVAGQIGRDTVSMGGFTVEQQTFLAVDDLTTGLLDGSVSGILGLAFSTIASTRAIPFWQTLAQDGQLTAPEMSFYMTRFRDVRTANVEEPGGIFTLGGTNSSLFTGEIEFLDIPVDPPTFWLLSLSAVTVQGKKVPISSTLSLSAIDTGTTLIGGPTSDVEAIWAAVPGSQPVPTMQGFFSFPCNTDVAVTMSFGGKSWPINTADMNLGRLAQGSSQCVGGIFDLSLGSNIVSGDGNPNWVVGATFLKNVYSVYRSNPPSIGFAQLSDAVGGSGTTPSLPTSSSDAGLTTSSITLDAPLATLSSPTSSGAPGAGPTDSNGSAVRNGGSSNKAVAGTLLVSALTSLFVAWLL
ncbi:hypothetical protein D9615_008554 [Tricholomella constricta]|uniref:Peptidase A1 domain-containing protein n=1 Tax=Tricholomella constricta TaxID=117010 RepID=A0A8H5M0M2_9AGAR|nr:hypothetical protein D9615_008554 [Tricholomella constricta]